MAIDFNFQTKLVLTQTRKLKNVLRELFQTEGKDLNALSYVFCDDEFLREINSTYLKHNYFTDIITFNLGSINGPVFGEIYISVDRVKENARKYKQPFRQELHRVIFHGALHLCGFNDKKPKQTRIMRKKENQYLSSFFSDVPRETK